MCTTWNTCQIWDIYDTYDDTKVHTTWEVPERYLNLSPVGSGAFGQVFFGDIARFKIVKNIIFNINIIIIIIIIEPARYLQQQIQSVEARMGET